MTMETGQQQAPVNGGGMPPVDPDASKYEALRKELGVEAEQQEPEEQQPEAKPAQEEPPEKQEEPERAEPDHVPRSEHENVQKALKEARAAQKATEERMAQFMRLVEESRTQRQPEAEKKPEAPKIPAVEEDPIGHFNARLQQYEEALRTVYQQGGQQHQQVAAHLQEQAMWGHVQQAEAEIRTQKPDYDEACNHLITTRARQLDRMYPSDSPQVIAAARKEGFQTPAEYKQHLLNQDGRGLIQQAMQLGVSPAAMLYDLALDAGYQPKAKGPDPTQKAKQQIEAAKKGRNASISISGGAGNQKGSQDMSLADLADLAIEDPAAFDKAWDEMKRMGRLG